MVARSGGDVALTDDFQVAMVGIYKQALVDCKYKASYFLGMVSERGGVQAAKDLLGSSSVSDGFTRLWECGRLDLTVEALVLRPEWNALFDEAEREIARKRLADMGYVP